MIGTLILGLLIFASVHLFIKLAEKIDKELKPLRLWESFLLCVFSFAGAYLSGVDTLGIALGSFCILTMLLFNSYVDCKSGMVYVFPVYITLALEGVFVVYQWICGMLTTKEVCIVVALAGLLLPLVLAGLSPADAFIYIACMEYLSARFSPYHGCACLLLIFASNVIALQVRLLKGKCKWKEMFPFTTYICMGFYISLFVMQLAK